MSTARNSNHIKLPAVASSLIQSAIQRETSGLVSSVVMASPSLSSKARMISSQYSSAAVASSTPPMIQPPVTSRTNHKFSSRTESESLSSESSHNAKSSFLMSLTIECSTRDTATISLDDKTSVSVPQGMRSSAVVSTLADKSSSLAVSKTVSSRTSVSVRVSVQASENLSSLSSSSTKPETMTELLTQSPAKPTNWIPFSTSDKFSSLNTDSYNHTLSSSSSRFSGHEIHFSSGSESSVMRSELAASSPSYSQTSSQIPHGEVSTVTPTSAIFTRSFSHVSSQPMPRKRSSVVSEDQNFSTSVSFSASTLLEKSKLHTSSSVPAASPKSEIASVVVVSTFICEGRGRNGFKWSNSGILIGSYDQLKPDRP